jgi:DNA-binding FadR family transcriptional regulator
MKHMQRLTSQVVALERANDIVEEKLSATARLERVQQVIDEELGWAVQEARRDGGDRSALADVILKLAGEVRQQLGLQLAISRTLVDLRVVKEFHDTVVEAIREESPETARQIVARLKDRRALRPTVEFPTLTGGSGADLA